VDLDDFTYAEYQELATLLTRFHYEGNGAKAWLRTYLNYDKNISRVTELPLDQMPLYINDPSFSISTVAKWRLRIAR
jgi:hypothetical protein